MTASVIAEIGFKINTSDLDTAAKGFGDVDKAANKTARATQQVEKEFGKLSARSKVAKAANDELFGSLKNVDNAATRVASSIGASSGAVTAIGVAFAATTAIVIAGTAAMVALGAATIQTAADMEKLQNQAASLGLSVEDFQALSYAADQIGVSVDTLANGMQKLAINSQKAADAGKGKLHDAFVTLNLDAAEMARLSPDAQIDKIAESMKGLSAGRQLQLAKTLGITELLPVLKSGADGIRELTSEANKLGLIKTEAQVQAFASLDDAVGKVSAQLKSLGVDLQSKLVPGMTESTEKVSAFLEILKDTGVIDRLGSNLAAILDTVSDLAIQLSALGVAFVGLVAKVLAAAKAFKEWGQAGGLGGEIARRFSAEIDTVTNAWNENSKELDRSLMSYDDMKAKLSRMTSEASAAQTAINAVNKALKDREDATFVGPSPAAGFVAPVSNSPIADMAAQAMAEKTASDARRASLEAEAKARKEAEAAAEATAKATASAEEARLKAITNYNAELADSKVILEQMKLASAQVGATVDSVADAQTLATEALKLGVVYTDGIQANEQAILNTINEKINVERAINTELLKQQETRKNIAAAAEVENINRNAQIEAARARAAETKSDASVFDTGAFTAGPDKAAELESIFKLQEEALARERDLKKQYAEEEIRDKELLEAEKARIDSVYNAQATAMEEEQARQRKAIHQQEVNDRLSVGTELFGRLADVAKAGGKKMGIIAKGAALAQAAISGATAVLKALELGPIYGPPAAAVMAGLVGAQIGIIAATPLAKGGVLDSPQIVGSVGGNPALAGEAGPEAVLPLARGKDGKLGVQMNGGGSNGNTYNFNTVVNGNNGNGQDSQQLAQQIANAQRQMIRQELGEQQRSGNILNPSISKVF